MLLQFNHFAFVPRLYVYMTTTYFNGALYHLTWGYLTENGRGCFAGVFVIEFI